MTNKILFLSTALLLAALTSVQGAGLLQLDFAIATGEAEGWDIIDEILAEDECNYLDDVFTPCTIFELTDRAGSDDDITLEILEVPFIGNTAPHIMEDQTFDGVGVPVAALGDYQYRNPDTAGSSAPFRFSNIDPGSYNVTVFEGRTNDSNGQFAKLWVGDANGSNEPGEQGEHEGKNTADFAAGSATLTLDIGEGDFLWYRHLEDNSGGISGMIIRPLEGGPFPVEGPGTIGSVSVSATRGNQVFSDPEGDYVDGLGQSWYAAGNPASKSGIDAVTASMDRAVPFFQAEGTTWWTGSSDAIDGVNIYPEQVLADPLPFDGEEANLNNYTVKLIGEIRIDESGPVRFLDGIDDYTYVAIDLDRSGVAGDTEDEVLIDDNDWTNTFSTTNGGAPIVEVDFQDVPADGEWLAIEMLMAEGGGGDSGILYWDAQDEDEEFPLDKGEGIFDDVVAETLFIPDSHLRSKTTAPVLLSGEVSGSVPASPTGWEVDVDPATGSSDVFAINNPDASIYTTVMDVDGTEIHINALGDVTEGTAFQIISADTITGTPTIATEGWSFDPATGSVVFGEVTGCNPNTLGDIDGSGDVAFADFLILSQNFGQAATDHTTGDIDCSGDVAFADFLVLSQNFGQTVGGAQTVPEPSAFALFGFAALLGGFVRRRRA